MNADAREIEARRQQTLLAAITARAGQGAFESQREQGARAERGLAAYRANAHALAGRALGAACPTLVAMLGAEDFEQLAREFWRTQPPERGDIGEWGDALPAWLDAHPGLREWPWLADSARLDLALHRCERAADANFEAGSLSLLQTDDPARVRLVLRPGAARVEARWPVVSIHAAHRPGAGPAAFEAVRQAIAAREAETAFVARSGWRAEAHALDEATAAWTQALLDQAPLDQALRRSGAAFDFAAWFARALREGWLWRAERIDADLKGRGPGAD